MQYGMSDFTGGVRGRASTHHRGLIAVSPNTSRPHGPASHERDACHEKDCFGPRQ